MYEARTMYRYVVSKIRRLRAALASNHGYTFEIRYLTGRYPKIQNDPSWSRIRFLVFKKNYTGKTFSLLAFNFKNL